jgi:hypothetical protein
MVRVDILASLFLFKDVLYQFEEVSFHLYLAESSL